MRQVLPALLFALSPCLLAVPAIAEDTAPATVMAIDDALFSKQSELQDAKKATQTQQTAVDNQQAELDRLNKQTQSLDAALKTAKANLERDYQKMIDEPELDITGSQNAYQAAWSDIKQNQKARLEAEQKLQEQQAALAQTKAAQQGIEQSIAKLDQDKLRARVERLRSELNRTGEQKVSFTNACSADMTLAQCAKQTTDLALQKAVKQFQAWLIDETSEVAWVNLAIRSNQYNDKVSVDGVSYGSIPVEIMLPVGNHMITVEKEGYRSFHQELSINSDHTLRAVLREQANILKQGFKFADSLKGNIKAPEMITLVSGEYLLGENASRQVRLDHAFAVSATPITVGEFETFVNQTGYQTDAELQNVCIAVNNSEVTPIPDSYWRNPGFKQSAQSPAVCISQNDANAYAHWLSKQTGFTYRLPSEDEWEVAARSGSKTSYWWGDNFGSGQANTGWGGTPWSNKSTSPVRSFEPNRLGFYDVVGNVWQWTNDARGLAKGGAWSFSPEMAKKWPKQKASCSFRRLRPRTMSVSVYFANFNCRFFSKGGISPLLRFWPLQYS